MRQASSTAGAKSKDCPLSQTESFRGAAEGAVLLESNTPTQRNRSNQLLRAVQAEKQKVSPPNFVDGAASPAHLCPRNALEAFFESSRAPIGCRLPVVAGRWWLRRVRRALGPVRGCAAAIAGGRRVGLGDRARVDSSCPSWRVVVWVLHCRQGGILMNVHDGAPCTFIKMLVPRYLAGSHIL